MIGLPEPSIGSSAFTGRSGAPDVEFIVYEPADCRRVWFNEAERVRQAHAASAKAGRGDTEGLRYWRSALSREELDLFGDV